MTLPSMVLATAFGIGHLIFRLHRCWHTADLAPAAGCRAGFVLAALGMALWYRHFRLPFSAFLTGAFVLGAVYSLTASARVALRLAGPGAAGFRALFDLRRKPAFATATLLFGIGAFLAGMWFDTRDPAPAGPPFRHRLLAATFSPRPRWSTRWR